jgi:hypothetical protein
MMNILLIPVITKRSNIADINQYVKRINASQNAVLNVMNPSVKMVRMERVD